MILLLKNIIIRLKRKGGKKKGVEKNVILKVIIAVY